MGIGEAMLKKLTNRLCYLLKKYTEKGTNMEITSIKIKLDGDKQIKLSLDEAKKLHEILNDLFPPRKEYIPYPMPWVENPVCGREMIVTCYK